MVFGKHKIFLLVFFFLLICKGIYSQTVVQPVLTLNAPGYNDQDDICIWIHPGDKSLSTIISSDKNADKIFVYDLEGNVLQTIDVSGHQPGNIDVRYNFLLAGVTTDIVAYNKRSGSEIVVYKVDRYTRLLWLAGSASSESNYGFCLYKSPVTGKYYGFISDESSNISQYELSDSDSDGTIEFLLVRQMSNGSGKTEGMVTDDETAKLYAANESSGIYKFEAEPDSSSVGTLIASTNVNGLTPDVEGLTIYYASNGDGYLIASSQGSSDFKVYIRKAPHTYIKTIELTDVGSTDGIDVTNVSLGDLFPFGIFLAHDGTSSPYVIKGCKWEDLGLDIDITYWDPGITALPVEISIFSSELIGNQIKLFWRTESEINNFGFNIERSAGPLEIKWETIGFVEGHGNSNSPKEYSFIDLETKQSHIYSYRLKQIDNDGTYEYSDVIQVEFNVPDNFFLSQNYPNPFNPVTNIEFINPLKQLVILRVYDVLGREVTELINEQLETGKHSVVFVAEEIPSGTYIYSLTTPEKVLSKKMTIIK